ncbi:MAG: DNA polymerase I [Candidatus Theseobacter exili]|nr:DNA polymerase I [Candidatus Theseobacter exili]
MLAILDGSSYLYRAFYAVSHLTNSKNEPTNAIFGFLKMLQKILRNYSPSHLAIVFDTKGPTFRNEIFEEYKAHRKPMPEDLIPQIPRLKDVLKAHKYMIYEKAGFEADDVIGTLSTRAADNNFDILIFSPDKDLLQLVNDKVHIVSGGKDERILFSKDVIDKFGIPPKQIPNLLALAGDASDGIPGVPGVGNKTASALLQQFGDIDSIFSSLEQVKSDSIREKLRKNEESALMSLSLTVIRTNVDMNISFEECQLIPPDTEALRSLYKELEFHDFIRYLPNKKKAEYSYTKVENGDSMPGWLLSAQVVSIAISIQGSFYERIVEGIALSTGSANSTVFFPLAELSKSHIKNILNNPSVKKIGYDLKTIFVLLNKHGINIAGLEFDIMIASHLLSPDLPPKTISELSFKYLEESPNLNLSNAPQQWMVKCKECELVYKMKDAIASRLNEGNLADLFSHLEMPLIPVLANMETTGIKVRPEVLESLSRTVHDQLKTIKTDIEILSGSHFNINSQKELSRILFEEIGLSPIKKTKTGFSTDASVLKELGKIHPLPNLLLEYRHLEKLRSTYIDALPKLINIDSGKIHTTFSQCATATGRLSSINPNLQNIPIKSVTGRKIRGAFVTSNRGNVLLSADYSQIELRILAHFSKDKTLLAAFEKEKDIHQTTAAIIYDIDPEQVDKAMRSRAKTINFGIIYGMSSFGLAKELDMSFNEARIFIDNYFRKLPGVSIFIDNTLTKARKKGYIETLYGRKRFLPSINNKNQSVRQHAERIAINTPIQGTAAELIKKAMIKIHSIVNKSNNGVNLLLQIHDELIFEVPRSEIILFQEEVRREMENVTDLRVKLAVNLKIGNCWEEI